MQARLQLFILIYSICLFVCLLAVCVCGAGNQIQDLGHSKPML